MSKRKRSANRVLSDQELQNIVNNDFHMPSDDDEEERAVADEFLSDSSCDSSYDENISDSSSDSCERITPRRKRVCRNLHPHCLSFDSDSDTGGSNDNNAPQNSVSNDGQNQANATPNQANQQNQANANPNQANQSNNNRNAPLNNRNAPRDPTIWHTDRLPPRLMKFSGQEQVNLNGAQPNSPADYFLLLFDKDMMHNIIRFTNVKAKKLTDYKPQNRRSPLQNFSKILYEEFLKFIALAILMGNISMPSLKHYWRVQDLLYKHPIIGKVMPRNRFEVILRALRFYNTDDQNIAKKDKISYVISNCVSNFKKYYSPKKQLVIDEALLGFKGRLSYKQYIPLKRSRFGIKLYELSCSNGFILDIILYTGKGTVENEDGHECGVVMQLMKGYFNKGHALYIDNFYTSIPLVEKLERLGTQVTGTLRLNRRGIPDVIKKTKLKRGESVSARRGNVMIQKWFDKKEVTIISSRHNGIFEEIRCRFGKSKLKPKAVIEYNRYMGGVDKADQLTSYYTTPRKTMRWQLKVFFHMIDLCLWNALHLYNFSKPKSQQLNYLAFRDSVIKEFIGETNSAPPVPQPVSDHYPVKMAKRQRCKYCAMAKIRSATFHKCDTCHVYLCTKKDCFSKFHREKLYRNL